MTDSEETEIDVEITAMMKKNKHLFPLSLQNYYLYILYIICALQFNYHDPVPNFDLYRLTSFIHDRIINFFLRLYLNLRTSFLFFSKKIIPFSRSAKTQGFKPNTEEERKKKREKTQEREYGRREKKKEKRKKAGENMGEER
jgi:hypothetical protein